MMTDDARIVESKACQLEAWYKDTKQVKELWAYPACNIGTNAEVTIGGSYERMNGETYFANETYQIKSLFKTLEESPLAFGVTLGNPFDLGAVTEFCRRHNLWLIEDNCDALGG